MALRLVSIAVLGGCATVPDPRRTHRPLDCDQMIVEDDRRLRSQRTRHEYKSSATDLWIDDAGTPHVFWVSRSWTRTTSAKSELHHGIVGPDRWDVTHLPMPARWDTGLPQFQSSPSSWFLDDRSDTQRRIVEGPPWHGRIRFDRSESVWMKMDPEGVLHVVATRFRPPDERSDAPVVFRYFRGEAGRLTEVTRHRLPGRASKVSLLVLDDGPALAFVLTPPRPSAAIRDDEPVRELDDHEDVRRYEEELRRDLELLRRIDTPSPISAVEKRRARHGLSDNPRIDDGTYEDFRSTGTIRVNLPWPKPLDRDPTYDRFAGHVRPDDGIAVGVSWLPHGRPVERWDHHEGPSYLDYPDEDRGRGSLVLWRIDPQGAITTHVPEIELAYRRLPTVNVDDYGRVHVLLTSSLASDFPPYRYVRLACPG